MTESQVLDYVTQWATRLGLLPEWRITVKAIPLGSLDDHGSDELRGTCLVDARYATASVRICADNDDEAVEETILHELLHICLADLMDVMAPMDDSVREMLEERLVSRLTRALLALRRGVGFDDVAHYDQAPDGGESDGD